MLYIRKSDRLKDSHSAVYIKTGQQDIIEERVFSKWWVPWSERVEPRNPRHRCVITNSGLYVILVYSNEPPPAAEVIVVVVVVAVVVVVVVVVVVAVKVVLLI
ncbi:hypothetical protein ElyMa_006742900 [Elysia marginata]|uniref:Uncharacterized protein n=1 Tax=Elysia marginata TaxID=1093978 RepID=A0AAV4IUR7_9GAST|nr:hypothetical protein ElyMa_006742900 [Elysia marginata]